MRNTGWILQIEARSLQYVKIHWWQVSEHLMERRRTLLEYCGMWWDGVPDRGKQNISKKRGAVKEKLYFFISSRARLDRIIFRIIFTISWKTPKYCSTLSKLDLGILNQPWDLYTCSQWINNSRKCRGKQGVFFPTNYFVFKPLGLVVAFY